MGIYEQYTEVAAEVARVCEECGRDPRDVMLIGVSKTVDVPAVQAAIDAGATNFGENRPEQLMAKHDAYPQVNWHFIGNIQSRRIRDIVGRAVLIHSLYQERHAEKIDQVAAAAGIVQDVLVEVNVSGEESKSGVTPADAPAFVKQCAQLSNLRVRGLMTMAPAGDMQAAQAAFEGLAVLAQEIRTQLSPDDAAVFTELSMGMTDDWPYAIAAGATMVRIGRAIFAERG